MNRLKFSHFAMSIIAAFLLLSFSGNLYGQKKNNNEDNKPRFAVISDIHFENNVGDGAVSKVTRALKNIYAKKDIDALFIVGDLTNRGIPEQYDLLLTVFNNPSIVPSGSPVYYVMGNHEYMNKNGNPPAIFKEKLKQPLNQFITIKDYPFITISMNGNHEDDYNAEAKKFLAEKMAFASRKYPGKPIFVFTHIPPQNTCWGSQKDGGWGTDVFLPILEKYPQAVVFSGHSHYPLGDPRSIDQTKFTAINDGSTSYSEMDANLFNIGSKPENFENITEGVIVNILPNNSVEIERWDTYQDEEIKPRWMIEFPHDGRRFTYKNRNGLPAPVFANGAVPSVRVAREDSCVVTFPQATDNDVVLYYLVEICEGNNVVKSFTKYSQFYLNSKMPERLSVSFSGLPKDKELTARITAIDSYNNRSNPIKSSVFSGKGYPRFVVISDTHFENNTGEGARVKVPKALKILFSKSPKPDAIFIVGDVTNRGKAEEYRQLLSTFNDKSNVPDGVEIFYMMGYNHDKSESGGQEVFLDIVKQPLHQYAEIKGYPFITISEGGRRETPYNIEARKFLAEKMKYAAERFPGKPIFVFMHIPPLNTCYGSSETEGWGTDFFTPVLEKYPQTVVFSGHSHFPLADPRSIHQDKFTAINDGSITYGEVEPNLLDIGIHPEKHEYVTEGIIVNISADNSVEIERWDTYRNEEILPRWNLKAPYNGSNFTYKNRNGLPAPVFSPKAVAEVSKVSESDSSCVISFPQATDNEVVHNYLIEVIDKNKVVATSRIFSQYYLNSEKPAVLKAEIRNLPIKRKLVARITAFDSYNNASQPIITKAFKL